MTFWDSENSNIIEYFLGIHKIATIYGLHTEMGWLNTNCHYDLCKLHFLNCVIKMNSSRLTKEVL